ncbi:MAG: NAD-dependent epimerase/dehydratase family protein [Bacteroidetes bacterium]|nr:NAD-dependent epimerase/dehydratase family protein [Bacteroidota bacterium]
MNLVTGATGIIGANTMLQLLLSNKPVIASKQANSNLEAVKNFFSLNNHINLFNNIKWVEIDFDDVLSIEEHLKNIEVIYNCIGFVSFNNSRKKKLLKTNYHVVTNIVNACLSFPKIALCHVSSVATLHNQDQSELNELTYWKPSGCESAYAYSKYKGECEVWRGIEEGLNAVIVNPGVVLSAGFTNNSSSALINFCSKPNKFYTQGIAPYISASDVSKSMIMLIDKKLFGQRYILVEGNYTFKTIFTLIQNEHGYEAPTKSISKNKLHLISFFEKISTFITGKERKLSKSAIQSAFNNQKYISKHTSTLFKDFEPIKATIQAICTKNKSFSASKKED